MHILQQDINFDRFVRGMLMLAVVALLIFGLNYLSTVLARKR